MRSLFPQESIVGLLEIAFTICSCFWFLQWQEMMIRRVTRTSTNVSVEKNLKLLSRRWRKQDDDKKSPTDFNECVSREELEAAQQKMEETVNKAVHDALIAMKLGSMLGRVDRWVSELTEDCCVVDPRTSTTRGHRSTSIPR